MSHLKRAVLLLAIVVIAGLSACGGSDDSTSLDTSAIGKEAMKDGGGSASPAARIIVTDATFVIVKNGEPFGGVQELEYSAGEQIRFTVASDVADEVHVHGYDLSKDVKAGGTVTFSFPADLEGIFEVELEERGTQIAELRVNP